MEKLLFSISRRAIIGSFLFALGFLIALTIPSVLGYKPVPDDLYVSTECGDVPSEQPPDGKTCPEFSQVTIGGNPKDQNSDGGIFISDKGSIYINAADSQYGLYSQAYEDKPAILGVGYHYDQGKNIDESRSYKSGYTSAQGMLGVFKEASNGSNDVVGYGVYTPNDAYIGKNLRFPDAIFKQSGSVFNIIPPPDGVKIIGEKLEVGGAVIACSSSTQEECQPTVEIFTKGDATEGTAALHWKSKNVDTIIIDPDPTEEPGASSVCFVEPNEHGSCAIHPVADTTYTIKGTKNGVEVQDSVIVDVGTPTIKLTSTATSLGNNVYLAALGSAITISWEATNADEIKMYADQNANDSDCASPTNETQGSCILRILNEFSDITFHASAKNSAYDTVSQTEIKITVYGVTISADPLEIAPDETFVLTWDSNDVKSLEIYYHGTVGSIIKIPCETPPNKVGECELIAVDAETDNDGYSWGEYEAIVYAAEDEKYSASVVVTKKTAEDSGSNNDGSSGNQCPSTLKDYTDPNGGPCEPQGCYIMTCTGGGPPTDGYCQNTGNVCTWIGTGEYTCAAKCTVSGSI